MASHRIKCCVVPSTDIKERKPNWLRNWRRYLPTGANCFTFELGFGVESAGPGLNAIHDGRWLTILRDGQLQFHPFVPALVNHNRDTGGLPEGDGNVVTIREIEKFIRDSLTSPRFWEYIGHEKHG